MNSRTAWAAALIAHILVASATGRPLTQPSPELIVPARHLLADPDLLVSLDASNPTPELLALSGTRGDATWASQEDPQAGVELVNAGFDQAYEGSVVFTPPAPGSDSPGTYGEMTDIKGASDGLWGTDFSAVVWYRGPATPLPAGSNPVLLQVLSTDAYGEYAASVTWRLAGFEDQSNLVSMTGVSAQPTYAAALPDCWQQLAVVKKNRDLTFYYDQQEAGSALAGYVVNDYGAAALSLGVDLPLLKQLQGGGDGDNTTDASGSLADYSADLSWLGGSLGSLLVFRRALTGAEVAALHTDSSARFSENLCSTSSGGGGSNQSPAPGNDTTGNGTTTVPPPPTTNNGTGTGAGTNTTGNGTSTVPPTPPSGKVPGTSVSPSPGTNISPPPTGTGGTGGTGTGGTGTGGTGTPASPPPATPSTLDNSTATVTGSGSSGTVANHLTITGGDELANFDAAKQEELKQAILDSLNLPDSYTTADIELTVVSVSQRPTRPGPGAGRKLQAGSEWVVVVEYKLKATPEVAVEVLVDAEVASYLFLRVQAPKIPWWKGPSATVCVSNEEGACGTSTPPVTPPVEVGCTASICFLLDGSKSVTNVDAWNDVVAAGRSIMYSITAADSVFDVFWFSNDVERIGWQVTRGEMATSNKFTKELVGTTPIAHGTWTEEAIETCRSVLLDQQDAKHRTIVLITDGNPTDLEPSLAAADQAKQLGIKMVVVGAGDINYDNLRALASGPTYVFANYALDSSQLLKLADLASQGVCREDEQLVEED